MTSTAGLVRGSGWTLVVLLSKRSATSAGFLLAMSPAAAKPQVFWSSRLKPCDRIGWPPQLPPCDPFERIEARISHLGTPGSEPTKMFAPDPAAEATLYAMVTCLPLYDESTTARISRNSPPPRPVAVLVLMVLF